MKWAMLVLGIILALAATLAAGYLLGQRTSEAVKAPAAAAGAPAAQQVWTCSMHPQVRLDGPGKCPICEMPLVPAGTAQPSGGGAPQLQLSDHALAMASVETVPVARREMSRDLRAVGKIEYNESSLLTVTARVDGYAEKLFVNVTGVDVKAGDHLMEVYSPDLLVAEQELLIALQDGQSGPLVETATLKLRRWGLTEQQVSDLINSRRVTDRVTLYSPIAGTVIEKAIIENSFFKAGDVLYRIANLDTVWVYLDIYEYDLAWIRYGQKVELTAEAYPGQLFSGMVTFVEPVLDEQTRTVRVPVHVVNSNHVLKPGMYVSAVVKARLGPDGWAAPTGIEGKFACPMHPQVLQDAAGTCPLCHMPLEQIPSAEPEGAHVGHNAAAAPAERYFCSMKCEGEKTYDAPGNCPVCGMKLVKVEARQAPGTSADVGPLAVAASAVLDSGTRRIVYVEKGRGMFESREVTLGPRGGDYFPVLAGLAEGERVVTRGGFLIDSQFQITGHASLYYPGGLAVGTAHEHGGAEAAPTSTPSEQAPSPPPTSTPPATPSVGVHQH